jgi:phosphate transport system substrate-binding protein|tara:strand:- start:1990 stop:2979 length:990 start_codon:yes stop_codon:yes gene_type:complete
MRAFNVMIAMFVSLIATSAAVADRANTINIVGSSTVYPFASKVAETFGEASGFNTPIIESTGSGGGMKLFCQGTGLSTPDVTNASRAMKSSEAETCTSNSVEFTEFMIGYDGIVISNSIDGVDLAFTIEELALATVEEIPNADCTSMTANPYTKWSDINPALPDFDIMLLGPPSSSGTRDAYMELVVQDGLKHLGCSKNVYKAAKVRADGVYVESGENDNLIIGQLTQDAQAVGIFGFSFLQNNADLIKGAVINDVEPEFENIASGDYPISRSLYFYVKNNHIGVIEGLAEYAEEFVFMAGPDGSLVGEGLIPGGDDDQDAMYEALESL